MIPIHPRIERLRPYVGGIRPSSAAGVQPIKLNQNESPYPASPRVTELLRSLSPELLREYPDSASTRLRAALSAAHGIPASQLICGNGSSELIALVIKTFLQEGDTLALPDPTFGLYAINAEMAGVRVEALRCDADMRFDPIQLAASGPQAIILANPNAPTGQAVGAAQIERLLQSYSGLVVVDEAYIHFAPEQTSVLHLIGRYDHLLVLRTFSKAYALSGARIGFAAGETRLVQAMHKARETFNVNAVAQLAAEAALTDDDYLRDTVSRIKSTRERFSAALAAAGWRVWPSSANFVLVAPPAGHSAKTMYDRLLERHIYVRYFDSPGLSDKLRISIGTDAQMDAAAEALAELVR